MADVNLTITIPDEHSIRVLDAFTALQEMKLTIRLLDSSNNYQFSGYFPSKGTDTNKVFVESAIKDMVRLIVKAYEEGTDVQRYKTEVSSLDPPSEDVPEGIVV